MDVFSTEKDVKIKKAFDEMQICDARIDNERAQKKAVVEVLAGEVDAEPAELNEAYRIYVKACEGNDGPINKAESSLNIVSRLINLNGN